MRIIVLVATIMLITGCVRVNYTPPTMLEKIDSRAYDIPFEKAWTGAVDWFAENNIIIEKIEKESGLLTAKYLLEVPSNQQVVRGGNNSVRDNFMDCGTLSLNTIWTPTAIERYRMLNVTVRKKGENQSRVTVNFFGEFKAILNDMGPVQVAAGRCVSTGKIEKSVLDFIEGESN